MKFKKGQYVWVRGKLDGQNNLDIYNEEGELVTFISGFGSAGLVLHTENKVTIPKYVAEYIIACKNHSMNLYEAMDDVVMEGIEDVYVWMTVNSNDETFARAWVDGYTVEQEKLYIVEIPDPNSPHKYRFLKKSPTGVVIYTGYNDDWKEQDENRLTEEEIKQDFSWAWNEGFAKEVE